MGDEGVCDHEGGPMGDEGVWDHVHISVSSSSPVSRVGTEEVGGTGQSGQPCSSVRGHWSGC